MRSWRTRRSRPAPRAALTASSWRRWKARASSRLARLVHAIRSTHSAAPKSATSRRRDCRDDLVAQAADDAAPTPAFSLGIRALEPAGDGRISARACSIDTPRRSRPTPGRCRCRRGPRSPPSSKRMAVQNSRLARREEEAARHDADDHVGGVVRAGPCVRPLPDRRRSAPARDRGSARPCPARPPGRRPRRMTRPSSGEAPSSGRISAVTEAPSKPLRIALAHQVHGGAAEGAHATRRTCCMRFQSR